MQYKCMLQMVGPRVYIYLILDPDGRCVKQQVPTNKSLTLVTYQNNKLLFFSKQVKGVGFKKDLIVLLLKPIVLIQCHAYLTMTICKCNTESKQ